LSFYGPFSLLLLLIFWAIVLIFGFSLLYWAPGNVIEKTEGHGSLANCIYFSGTTFFTLGLGDIVPRASFAKVLSVLEAGMGFGFLAVIISYLPALNQSFFRRETSISLLDAHVGSPPTAAGILQRHVRGKNLEVLHQLLYDWERWSAEFHESHLSYPLLAYFRSQHEKQSWLAALTSILDTCAFVMAGLEDACECQAELTFAIAKHAIVDLSLVFRCPLWKIEGNRFSLSELTYLHSTLTGGGLVLRQVNDMEKRLAELRLQYEPYIYSLARRFRLIVPPWILLK
jgi:Ion channel